MAGLDGANKSGSSSNAQCLKVFISKPRASSKYPEIKVIREKLKKNERMQGKKSTEYFFPQYVLIMFPNCVRVAYSKDTLKVFEIETD